MGAHALGAAAYAAKAAALGSPEVPNAVDDEIRWQLARMSAEARSALALLAVARQGSRWPAGIGTSRLRRFSDMTPEFSSVRILLDEVGYRALRAAVDTEWDAAASPIPRSVLLRESTPLLP